MLALKLQHVKGHQDRNTPYHRLLLLAQLNVDADAQAVRYEGNLDVFLPEVLLTECEGVPLEFPTGTVTAHHKTALRYQATAPALQAFHIQERYSWTPQTMAVTNWSAHGKAMQRHLNKRTFLMKLVHGLLPTNLKLHRSDPKRNKCPSCQTHVESWQHIMSCNSETHASWRVSLIKTVDSKCKALGTMPSLHAFLLQALCKWCSHPHDENAYQLHPQNATPALRRVIFQQNAIGWEHLFMGRFSSEWGSLQD
jgi:hypothetical protein